jgi:hypothetical protein
MSLIGTFRTWNDVRVESLLDEQRTKYARYEFFEFDPYETWWTNTPTFCRHLGQYAFPGSRGQPSSGKTLITA